MRRSERQAKTLTAILKLAHTGSVNISGRGIDEKGRPLYQITQYGGGLVCTNSTEEELAKNLLKDEAQD